MKKVLLTTLVCALAAAGLSAAPTAQPAKITNTRIVQAAQDTTLHYGGVKVFAQRPNDYFRSKSERFDCASRTKSQRCQSS